MFLQRLFKLSTFITYVSNVVQANEAENPTSIPLFFNNEQMQARNAYYPEINKHCQHLNYNKLSSGCIEVKLNRAALHTIIYGETNSSIALFDADNEYGNEIIWVAAKTQVDTRIPLYNYIMAELNVSYNRKGLLVFDNKYKLAMSVNQADGALKIQPCPAERNEDCYLVVKLNGTAINLQDLPNNQNKPIKINTTAHEGQNQNYFSLAFGYDQATAKSIGATNLLTNAALLTSIINQAMTNSKVPHISVTLQKAYIYPDPISTSISPLFHFSGSNRYGADIGILITSQLGACGLANFFCNQYEGDEFNRCPYFVLLSGCAEYSIAHELGHLFGCGHDLANADLTPFAYGHGYINKNANIRTIMAYPSGTTERIQFYSSPIVKSPDGAVIGNADTADNRRVLISQASIFAQKLHSINPPKLCPNNIASRGANLYSNPVLVNSMTFRIETAKRKNAPKLTVHLFSNTSQPLTFSFSQAKLSGGDICNVQFVNKQQVHIKVSNSKGKIKRNFDIYADEGTAFTGNLSFASNRNLVKVKCQA